MIIGHFEGIIPEGNYGAGTVIVWDEGTYESLEPGTKVEQEKSLLKQLKAGSIKIRMNGQKLRGEFALVKLKKAEDNAWLLIKHKDKYARETDVTKKDKSVVSGFSLDKVSKTSNNIYGQKKQSAKAGDDKKIFENAIAVKGKTTATKKAALPKTKKAAPSVKKKEQADGSKAAFPKAVSPMLATLIDKPFTEPGWIYEIKWDGYRAVALMNKGKVNLLSRNDKSFNEKFYPVQQALIDWNINAVVDGEVVVLSEKGLANFGSLQNWRSEADGELIYYVFDIMWLDGKDLTTVPLTRRREILQEIVPQEGLIRMSENFDTTPEQFLEEVGKLNMEGIMAKKADSLYNPGTRTKEWLKIKAQKRHEVVIGGYTQNEGSAKTFSSLLVGLYDDGQLSYIGKIGTGFNDKMQKEIMAKMQSLKASKPPFTEVPDVDKPSRFRPNPPKAAVTWLKPQLVCEVSYAEITTDGVMRHPSFEGLREDKKAKDVVKEKSVSPMEIKKKTASAKAPKKSAKKDIAEEPEFIRPVKAGSRKHY